MLLTALGVLLLIWVVLALIGLVVKGLLWLTLLAALAFVATGVWLLFNTSDR